LAMLRPPVAVRSRRRAGRRRRATGVKTMNTGLRFAAISLAVALALPGNAIAAYLMLQNPTTAQVQQNAIDDITSAQSALSQERGIAALTDTENAETVLLNAQQAGNLQY